MADHWRRPSMSSSQQPPIRDTIKIDQEPAQFKPPVDDPHDLEDASMDDLLDLLLHTVHQISTRADQETIPEDAMAKAYGGTRTCGIQLGHTCGLIRQSILDHNESVVQEMRGELRKERLLHAALQKTSAEQAAKIVGLEEGEAEHVEHRDKLAEDVNALHKLNIEQEEEIKGLRAFVNQVKQQLPVTPAPVAKKPKLNFPLANQN